MKLTKIFVPILAMVFAVGMAFATADTAPEDYAEKYVLVENVWHVIQVDCGIGQIDCMVMFADDPNSTPYQVYNTRNQNDLAVGSGQLKIIDGPVPSN